MLGALESQDKGSQVVEDVENTALNAHSAQPMKKCAGGVVFEASVLLNFSFTTIYVFLGLLGSVASIVSLVRRRKHKQARSSPIDKSAEYERSFTFTFRSSKRHSR